MTLIDRLQDIIGRTIGRPGGVRSPRIIVVGDSHADAIGQAIEFRKGHTELERIEVYRFAKEKGDVSIGNISFEGFLKVASGLTRHDHVFSAIGGNQYAVMSTVEHPVGLEVLVGPRDRDIHSDEAMLIPNRTLADYLYNAIRATDGRKLEAIKARTNARLTHLAPPPPKGDNKFIARYFERRFGELGMGELGPARRGLRLKVWQIQLAAMQRLCVDLGIDLMPPPPQTTDQRGFLAPHYYAKDATHANRRYGREVANQILARVAEHAAEEDGAAAAVPAAVQ